MLPLSKRVAKDSRCRGGDMAEQGPRESSMGTPQQTAMHQLWDIYTWFPGFGATTAVAERALGLAQQPSFERRQGGRLRALALFETSRDGRA